MYLYLAGPITGLTIEEAHAWRSDELLLRSLTKQGWLTLSPTRDRAWKGRATARMGRADEHDEFRRDIHDINKSQAVLMNLAGATEKGIGSMCELGYAYALDKPTVVVMEKGNPFDHMFVHQMAYRVCEAMFEAVAALDDVATKLREPSYA